MDWARIVKVVVAMLGLGLIGAGILGVVWGLIGAVLGRPGGPDRCPGCGYGLDGRSSGRCPECAREIEGSERSRHDAGVRAVLGRADRIMAIAIGAVVLGALLTLVAL